MKAVAKCVNGCDAPVHPPSKVLCQACFERLDEKFKALARSMGIDPDAVEDDDG